ncbi:hypothetical protein VDG1235_4881 [Verrucomicrobiia bacterium DG1235]|nr:hypothetical protein VDG1235_4881 [Verrucomicrobiae bacterium DG1235]
MTRLSEEEKQEFLEDALSERRREDFRILRERADRVLSVDELIEFLNWSQRFMIEDVSKRGPIQGSKWLI